MSPENYVELGIVLFAIALLTITFFKYVLPKIGNPVACASDDAACCQLHHRNLWEQVGEFPEVVSDAEPVRAIGEPYSPFGGEIRFIPIYHCAVCINSDGEFVPRVDTNERHKTNDA